MVTTGTDLKSSHEHSYGTITSVRPGPGALSFIRSCFRRTPLLDHYCKRGVYSSGSVNQLMPRVWIQGRRSFTSLLLGLLIVGCGTAPMITGTGNYDGIRATASLPAGTALSLKALVTDRSGQTVDVTADAVWSSSSSLVASVSGGGSLQGLTPGITTITAASAGMSGSIQINVTQAAISALQLSAAAGSVVTRGTLQYSALATYSNGTTGDVSALVQWSVSPASIAAIGDTGLLTGTEPGSYTVSASVGFLGRVPRAQ